MQIYQEHFGTSEKGTENLLDKHGLFSAPDPLFKNFQILTLNDTYQLSIENFVWKENDEKFLHFYSLLRFQCSISDTMFTTKF